MVVCYFSLTFYLFSIFVFLSFARVGIDVIWTHRSGERDLSSNASVFTSTDEIISMIKHKTKPHKKHNFNVIKSGSVTIIGDFWQPFCVGKIMAAIDHVHNSFTWRKNFARTGCVGQKIWREPRFSGLFILRSKSRRPCEGCLLGCSCAGLPIFQLKIARTLP